MNEYKTLQFNLEDLDKEDIRKILVSVCTTLEERGYNYIDQIMGFLLSGDLAYIPRQNDARSLMRKIGREKIIIELLNNYIKLDKHNNNA